MNPFLARFGLQDQPWLDPALAGAIFLISLLSALQLGGNARDPSPVLAKPGNRLSTRQGPG